MHLVEAVLGNATDPQWAERLAGASIDPLQLDHWEAQKNRFRKKTAGGVELAVSLDRGTFMRDGDIRMRVPGDRVLEAVAAIESR